MKVIDLRPDAKLLKSNFDGYKLSLDAVPILRLENINKPHKVKLTSSEYSLSHSMLFNLHNHLVPDPWLSNTAYYIDSTLTVQRIQYDTQSGRLKPAQVVYKFSNNQEQTEGSYNTEIKFISEKYAVLSNGTGILQIIDTGDRQKIDEWKRLDSLEPIDKSFIIQDARFKIDKGEKIIHCLLLHIDQLDGKFYNIIDWITLKEESSTKKWKSSARRTLQGKGSLYYLSLDVHCTSVVYSSNHEYKYTFDSVNEIVQDVEMEADKPKEFADSESSFQWSQKGEDITINFSQIPDALKDDYHVKCHQSHVEVKCGDEFLLNSDLFAEIDVDLTTWTLENDFLQLNLIKKSPELIWPYLTPGGPAEVLAATEKSNQLLSSQPAPDLNSQMEECDFGDDGHENDEYFIEQLDATTHKTHHKIFLASNHPLFSITLRPGFPKAIAVRNDVDCCLWLQQQITSEDEWSLKHEGTLNAFGYVQASKRDRKYMMCSPDMSLAVISESTRHLFIYRDSYSTATGLRKRTGPQLLIGQQKLVALDGTNGEIQGISVENDAVLLLTENAVLCLQLAEEE
ncbi:unnamed protein product [Chironomus riparius]|uniref:NudC domain-containing protein 1 n=1 Tax=Chironomus riparius TaxID=315576 RepID=A0A9N9WWM3_9DIPT|nr:unnamed protein product [Chironomus riparius]